MKKVEKEENSILNKILISIVVLLLILILVPVILPGEKEINIYNTGQENLNLLSVSSTAEKDYSPDQVEINLSIVTLDSQAKISQQENAKISDRVITALKQAGVSSSQIETTNYRVTQHYEWDGVLRRNVSRGYQTSNTIKLTLNDLTKTGSVIDVAVNAGANQVSGIRFVLSDELKKQAENEVLREASKLAKIKAQNIASGLGISVGKVYNVSESSQFYTPYFRSAEMYDMAVGYEESMPSTPINPEDIKISATVNVKFEI